MKTNMRFAVCAVLLALALWMVRMAEAAGPAVERRQASAVFTQADGCTSVQTVVTITQNAVVPSPYYPDGWVRTAWVSVLEQNVCTATQLLNASGQLSATTGLEIDRKLDGAQFSGTVLAYDGVAQVEGTLAVAVTWTGTGQANRQIWRTVSRPADGNLTLDGFGLSLRSTTTDAAITITK